jgi:hypothetical protein
MARVLLFEGFPVEADQNKSNLMSKSALQYPAAPLVSNNAHAHAHTAPA